MVRYVEREPLSDDPAVRRGTTLERVFSAWYTIPKGATVVALSGTRRAEAGEELVDLTDGLGPVILGVAVRRVRWG